MKVVVNGATAKLYLDNVLGAEVPFPFGQDLTFGIGTYVAAATDIATGRFDNVLISGGSAPDAGRLTAARQAPPLHSRPPTGSPSLPLQSGTLTPSPSPKAETSSIA
jgi:hypothetical protein